MHRITLLFEPSPSRPQLSVLLPFTWSHFAFFYVRLLPVDWLCSACSLDLAPKEILEHFNGQLAMLKAKVTEAEQNTTVQTCCSGNEVVQMLLSLTLQFWQWRKAMVEDCLGMIEVKTLLLQRSDAVHSLIVTILLSSVLRSYFILGAYRLLRKAGWVSSQQTACRELHVPEQPCQLAVNVIESWPIYSRIFQ